MPRGDDTELIRLIDIRKEYSMGEVNVPVLRDITLSVAHGEMLALMGTSGSGKTTLLNLIGCLDRPTSGEYYFESEDTLSLSPDELAELRNRSMGFVFQNFNLLPRTSALENVMIPLFYASTNLSEREMRRRAETLLHRLGLGDRAGYAPSRLSGGEQQRVAIARALINEPQLLLADEPTGNLDSRTSKEIMTMLEMLNREDGVTIVTVTHDAAIAEHARRIIHIRDGCIEDNQPQGTFEPMALSRCG